MAEIKSKALHATESGTVNHSILDIIDPAFQADIDDGYIEITIEDSEGQVLASQSYEDWSEDIQTIVVPKDGRYRIICKGRHARGSIQVNLE